MARKRRSKTNTAFFIDIPEVNVKIDKSKKWRKTDRWREPLF